MSDIGLPSPIDAKRASAVARGVLARLKTPQPPGLDELAALASERERDAALSRCNPSAADKKRLKQEAAKIRESWRQLARAYGHALVDLELGEPRVTVPDAETGLPVELSLADRREIVLVINRYQAALGIVPEKPAERRRWA